MANIFDPKTDQQQLAASIDSQVKNMAITQKKVYDTIHKLIYANPKFKDEYDAFDDVAAYSAFESYTQISMSADDLLKLLQVTKAALNWLETATIVDATDAATITF